MLPLQEKMNQEHGNTPNCSQKSFIIRDHFVLTVHNDSLSRGGIIITRGKYPCKNSTALSSLLNYSVELQEAVRANKTMSQSTGSFSVCEGGRKLLFAGEPLPPERRLVVSSLAFGNFGKHTTNRGLGGAEPRCPPLRGGQSRPGSAAGARAGLQSL